MVDHAGAYDRVPETDQGLYDYLLTRLAIEAQTCNTKAAARAVWEVLNACKIGDDATVTIGGEEWSLRAYLKQAAKALPEEAQPTDEEVGAAARETDHARQLREDAEKSWAEKEQENRDMVFDKLTQARKEATDRLGRNLPEVEGEIIDD